jgi:hypothetical protein
MRIPKAKPLNIYSFVYKMGEAGLNIRFRSGFTTTTYVNEFVAIGKFEGCDLEDRTSDIWRYALQKRNELLEEHGRKIIPIP